MILLFLLTVGILWSLYDLVPERKVSTVDPLLEERMWMIYNQFSPRAQDMSFEEFRLGYLRSLAPMSIGGAVSLAMRRMQ